MPTYATPQPISVEVDLEVGDLTFVASDRSDTVVAVTPTDPNNDASVQAAGRVRVAYSSGTLEIKQSVPWHHKFSRNPKPRLVSIVVELPADSHVRGKTNLGTVSTQGRLGAFEFTLDCGDFRLAEVTDGLRVKGSAGSIEVQRAHADVDAKTSTGSIRIAEVIRGTVELATSLGEIEVGVRQGSAVNVDARTKLGRVRNTLNGVDDPAQFADTVKVRARTNLEDIIVRRS
jgi:DUF4097 and DUF4098 domain-containing protein YvlB